MTTVLATFCNKETPADLPMLRVDLETHQVEPVVTGISRPVTMCTGMAADSTFVYVLYGADGFFRLAVLGMSDLRLAFSWRLAHVFSGHSILATDGFLYAVSTGSDEVLRYDLSGAEDQEPKTVWRASDARFDTHHVNSIAESDGDLVVSAFGAKAGTLWSTAAQGYLHNITRDERVKEGVHQPHTVVARDGALLYCESARRLLCSLDGPLVALDGYARGIAWTEDDLVCVATSVGRRQSKSTGLLANPSAPGEASGTCGISLVRPAAREVVGHIDLDWFGSEIYDLLVLPPAGERRGHVVRR